MQIRLKEQVSGMVQTLAVGLYTSRRRETDADRLLLLFFFACQVGGSPTHPLPRVHIRMLRGNLREKPKTFNYDRRSFVSLLIAERPGYIGVEITFACRLELCEHISSYKW